MAHLALIFYGLIQWATVTWSSQGRLVYSGISGIAVLFVIGLRTILPGRFRPFALGAVALFMAALSAAAPFAWIAPRYADPPPLTAAQLSAVPNRMEADFGAVDYPAEMRLLGYELESASAAPGGTVKLTLYWQSLVGMDRDWSVFAHVVDENDIVVAQRDTYPGLGLLPTRKWAVGQTVADTYIIGLPPAVYAPTRARIEVGLYDYYIGERLPVATGEQAGQEALTLSSLLVVPNGGDLPNSLEINFGNQIELAGYDMDRRAVTAGGAVELTLYWRGLRPMATNYSVFAHVRGAGETLWAQSDSWPQDGAAPTAAWTPGQLVEERRALVLNPDTAPGVYDVEIGLYDQRGDRLQIILPDGRRTDNFVYLSKIRVLP